MAYYISFLKTLSLKLNRHTIHFFYNEVKFLCVNTTINHVNSYCMQITFVFEKLALT